MSGSIGPSERALKIMAYVDGELDASERAEVERWISEDAEAVLFANDLAELGDIVQTGYREAGPAKAIASFDIADSIMTSVKTAAPKPASLAEARAKKRSASKTGTALWVAAGLAMAASVFLVTRGKEEAPLARSTTPIVQPATPAAPAPTNHAGAVDVENPGQSVSVFYLPDDPSSVASATGTLTTSVVVWVDESGAK